MVSYNEWVLDFLADYIANTHDNYGKKFTGFEISPNKSIECSWSTASGIINNPSIGRRSIDELSTHMIKEETVLFPYIKQLAASKNNDNKTVSSVLVYFLKSIVLVLLKVKQGMRYLLRTGGERNKKKPFF